MVGHANFRQKSVTIIDSNVLERWRKGRISCPPVCVTTNPENLVKLCPVRNNWYLTGQLKTKVTTAHLIAIRNAEQAK